MPRTSRPEHAHRPRGSRGMLLRAGADSAGLSGAQESAFLTRSWVLLPLVQGLHHKGKAMLGVSPCESEQKL